MSQVELQSAQSSQSVAFTESDSGESFSGADHNRALGHTEHTGHNERVVDHTQMEADKLLSDKVRIYDLAKEIGRDNAEVLDTCKKLGIPYKTHSSTISGQEADQVRETLDGQPASESSSSKQSMSSRLSPAAPASENRQSDGRKAPKPQVRRPVDPPTPKTKNGSSADERATSHATSHIVGLRKPTAPKPKLEATKPNSTKDLSQTKPPEPKPPEVKRPEAKAEPRLTPKPAGRPTLAGPPRRTEESEQITPPGDGIQPDPPLPQPLAEDFSADPGSNGLMVPPGPSASTKALDPAPALKQPPRPPVAPTRPAAPPAAAKVQSLSQGSLSQDQDLKPTQPERSPRDPSRRDPLQQREDRKKVAPVAAKPQLAGPPTRPVLKKADTIPEAPLAVPAAGRESSGSGSQESSRSSSSISTVDPKGVDQSVVALKPKRPRPTPAPRPQLVGPPVRPDEKAVVVPLEARDRPSRRKEGGEAAPGSTELIAPPTRPVRPETADSPRPPTRVKRRSEIDEEEDAKLAGAAKRATRGTTKRKRRRGADDTDSDAGETVVLSAAKQAELTALQPLPRPAAPPSQKPAASATPAPRPRPSQPRQRSQPAATPKQEAPSRPTSIQIEGKLTVQELADLMQIPATDIIRVLFIKGSMVNINQVLDISTIEMVAQELECEVELLEAESEAKKTEMLDIEDIEYLQLRSPVVTIMGHVDHGKTTLLDAIRKTNVVSGEAGGITQRIGAYHVDVEHEGSQRRVVFLDTPGHEAFTAMRARGAKVTDIAILVVAADDGVQPQTLEAISHARAANVPIVVAINKIDKVGCQPDRIKQQLSEHGLVPEEWGGETPMVEVSALSQINLDGLLEMLLLVAELGELQANPDRPAKGTVIEANLDRARGPVATLLVQNGTLRLGDAIVAGSVFGRVKAMSDDRGQRLEDAGPSSAVQLLGLSEVPSAGDEFEVYADEREARRVAEERQESQRQARLQQLLSRRVSLGTVSAQAQEGQLKELNLIIKTDVQGSVEAILASLQQLSQEEVQLRVLLAAPGEITETDVDLAAASEAIIIGFTTDATAGARQLADRYGVDIREYTIIYNLLEDITGAMEGLLEPEQVEEPLGQAEVRQVITIGRGNIAGCYVLSGKMLRNTPIRVRRAGSLIFEGRLDSLKRFKDDVREVASGFECGIGADKFTGWTEGDIIDAYQLVMKRRSLATTSSSSGRR